MSDFGNETSSATLRVGEKSIEALMKFLKFLLERQEKRTNAQIQEQKLIEMKLKKGERTAKLKVQGKVGYVKAKLLQKTGEPLVAINITLNEQQMKDFANLAKKYGLLYTSISDTRKSGEKVHSFYIREKDLAIAKVITDRMTEDLQVKTVEDLITDLNNKPDKSEQDFADLAYLERQKGEILRNGTRSFNDENAEIIFNDVCGEMQVKSLSFDQALNRFTDRDFSRDKPYYICERTNPTAYIELNSSYDKYAGEQYTRTDYKVFHNGIEQTASLDRRKDGKFTDERFSGRPKGYWQDLKSEMKQKGGFTDDIVVFNSKPEFDRYQQLYKLMVQENSVKEQKGGEYRDYVSVTDQLKKQLHSYNAELNENDFAVDKVTKLPLNIADVKDNADMFRVAESVLIAKQIANYKYLSEMEVKLVMDKQSLETVKQRLSEMPESDLHRVSAVEELTKLEAEVKNSELHIGSALQIERELLIERNQVSGIYAVNEVDKEYVAEHQLQEDTRDDMKEQEELDRDTRTMEEWKEQVSEIRDQTPMNSTVTDKSVDKVISSIDDR